MNRDVVRRIDNGRLTLLACLFLISLHVDARMPSANRECSTCHIMWLNEFKQDKIATLVPYDPKPIVETGKQDVSSTERMCFSCHDGFVLDSRFMWQRGTYKHPVGKKPSKHIKIPRVEGKQVFPLNDDGKVYCGTCHSAHGVDWNQKESAVFLRMKNVNSSLCVTCHEERTGGPKQGNHPVNKHIERQPGDLLRVGSKFGKGRRVICESCHRPHGAADKKILVMKNNDSNLCRSCHDDKKSVNQTKHNMALTVPDAVNVNGTKANETGPCSVCHIPHEARGVALWARERYDSKDRAAAPCLGCHNENGLAKNKPVKDHSHPTRVALSELGITVKNKRWRNKHPALFNFEQQVLPLYNASGQRVEHDGNVSCGSCHDPHSWSPTQRPPADPDDVVEQEGDGQNSFLRIAQGEGSYLCLNCHVDKQTLFFSKHNRDIGFKDKPKHKDRQTGVCAECHVAHNGKGPYMHANAPGGGRGAIEQMCTVCHRKDGLAAKKTTGEHSHPIGVGLENIGEKTSLPLFTRTGERHPQGKVDCATCHNVHQWDPNKRQSMAGAKAKVEGDGFNSFLRIANTVRSDLCTSCHRQQKTILQSEHDLTVTAADARNSHGQRLQRSGVCGACHSVHNAQITTALWGRQLAAVDNLQQSLCFSCHNASGLARAKVPSEFSHPEQVLAWSDRLRQFIGSKILPYIPVFSDLGQPALMGEITCTSCHNPHRWSARQDSAPGKNTEGTVLNSFLRNRSSENIVCADCHGRDALFRYKYFHAKTSRRDYPMAE